jgi:hypothetical protein
MRLAVALAIVLAGSVGAEALAYRYDPTWPKLPLPNAWTFEGITGLYVDRDDVIWVLQRPRDFDRDPSENYAALNPPSARCRVKPPAVLAFDIEGNLKHAWGDPERVPGGPRSEHTILVDAAGQRQDNQQTDILMRGVAAAELDEAAREIYIADGYLNRRVLVYDVDTGAFRRGWGAYGKPLAEISNDEPPRYDPSAKPHGDFQGSEHAVRLSADGLVYVSDRQALDRGAAGSITFSRPPAQAHLFVTDIMNNVVWILDRQSGATLGQIGFMSRAGAIFMGCTSRHPIRAATCTPAKWTRASACSGSYRSIEWS